MEAQEKYNVEIINCDINSEEDIFNFISNFKSKLNKNFKLKSIDLNCYNKEVNCISITDNNDNFNQHKPLAFTNKNSILLINGYPFTILTSTLELINIVSDSHKRESVANIGN